MRSQIPALAALSCAAAVLCYGARFYVFWIPEIAHMAIGDQSFYDWYAAVILLPIVPVLAALAAWSASHRAVAFVLAAVSGAFVPVEWRLFREMMRPGIWGDAIGPTVTPSPGVVLPLAAHLPFALLPAITVISIACVAWQLIAWIKQLRQDHSLSRAGWFAFAGGVVVYVAASATLATIRPLGVSWVLLWRVCAVLAAIAAMTIVVSALLSVSNGIRSRRTLTNLGFAVVAGNAAWNLVRVTYAL